MKAQARTDGFLELQQACVHDQGEPPGKRTLTAVKLEKRMDSTKLCSPRYTTC